MTLRCTHIYTLLSSQYWDTILQWLKSKAIGGRNKWYFSLPAQFGSFRILFDMVAKRSPPLTSITQKVTELTSEIGYDSMVQTDSFFCGQCSLVTTSDWFRKYCKVFDRGVTVVVIQTDGMDGHACTLILHC